MLMHDTKMEYFPGEDVLHISLASGPESDSVELSPFITAELGEGGELIGIEIIKASIYLRDTILETAQAKLMDLKKVG
jgi:uncharacterized protein YuzE